MEHKWEKMSYGRMNLKHEDKEIKREKLHN